MTLKYTARNDAVIVRRVTPDKFKGLVLPDQAIEDKRWMVECVGPDVKDVRVGMRVVVGATPGSSLIFPIPGEKDLLCVWQKDVLAIVEEVGNESPHNCVKVMLAMPAVAVEPPLYILTIGEGYELLDEATQESVQRCWKELWGGTSPPPLAIVAPGCRLSVAQRGLGPYSFRESFEEREIDVTFAKYEEMLEYMGRNHPAYREKK